MRFLSERMELLRSRSNKETITERKLLCLLLEKSSKDLQRRDFEAAVATKVISGLRRKKRKLSLGTLEILKLAVTWQVFKSLLLSRQSIFVHENPSFETSMTQISWHSVQPLKARNGHRDGGLSVTLYTRKLVPRRDGHRSKNSEIAWRCLHTPCSGVTPAFSSFEEKPNDGSH